MIKYAVYARKNPCGSVAGSYLVRTQYLRWMKPDRLTDEVGMTINEAFAEASTQHINYKHNCGCQFEIVELKDGIPNHSA